jgi:hypothetical protein
LQNFLLPVLLNRYSGHFECLKEAAFEDLTATGARWGVVGEAAEA